MKGRQLLPGAKSPGHSHCVHPCILPGFHICIRVAKIQAALLLYSQLPQNGLHAVRGGLSADPQVLPLPVDLIKALHAEHGPDIVQRPVVGLVGEHRAENMIFPQKGQELPNPVIGLHPVQAAVLKDLRIEGQGLLKPSLVAVSSCRHGPLHQFFIAVPGKQAGLLRTHCAQPKMLQGAVHRLLDGVHRIDQGSIQIKDTALIHNFSFLFRLRPAQRQSSCPSLFTVHPPHAILNKTRLFRTAAKPL